MLLQPLGEGGEGSVYLAVHTQTQQLRALKILPVSGSSSDLREISVMKKLRHPSLPEMIDVLETDEGIVLVMEYVRGENLQQIMDRRHRLTPELTLDAGIQIGQAVRYLHSRKEPVFHLDIKPANIICAEGGRLVLADFGAAFRGNIEEDGKRRGTDGFAAPELYDPEAVLTGAADIYELGAVLYYLISGVHFSASLIKSRIPGCPDTLEQIILKCLQADPEKRYENAEAFCNAVSALQRSARAEKTRIGIWLCLLLLLGAGAFSWQHVAEEFHIMGEENWNYDKLLKEALCAPEEESLSYYRRAIFLRPDDEHAYLQLLEQMDMDRVITEDEDRAFRSLIHSSMYGEEQTYEDMFAENSRAYAEFALKTGLVYWYDSENDALRRSSTGWFAKAEEAAAGEQENTGSGISGRDGKSAGEETEDTCGILAEAYRKLGSCRERLEHPDGEVRLKAAAEYWNVCSEILEGDLTEHMEPYMQVRFCEEMISRMIGIYALLADEGISADSMKTTARQAGQLLDKLSSENTFSAGTLENMETAKQQLQTLSSLLNNLEKKEPG